jgi:S1-C subfamily serine protease
LIAKWLVFVLVVPLLFSFVVLADEKPEPIKDLERYFDTPLLVQPMDGSPAFWDSLQPATAPAPAGSYSSRMGHFPWLYACFVVGGNNCNQSLYSYQMTQASDAAAARQGVYHRSGGAPYSTNEVPLRVSTWYRSVEDGLEVTVEQKHDTTTSETKVKKFRISVLKGFESIKVKFSEHLGGQNRWSLENNQDARLDNLAWSSVQLNLPNEVTGLSQSSGRGTGFFISKDGYLVTNHHVVRDSQGLMSGSVHSIELRQVARGGRELRFQVPAKLMTYSQEHDFALIKVKIPPEMTIFPLKLATKTIGPEILTFGFPADQTGVFSSGGSSHQDTAFTFSRGSITALARTSFLSTAAVHEGASGSAVVTESDLSLFGLISEKQGGDQSSALMSVIRPMHLISAEYDLPSYLNGSKAKRMETMLAELSGSKDLAEATPHIQNWKTEKTLILAKEFAQLISDHPDIRVRRAILKAFSDNRLLVPLMQ